MFSEEGCVAPLLGKHSYLDPASPDLLSDVNRFARQPGRKDIKLH